MECLRVLFWVPLTKVPEWPDVKSLIKYLTENDFFNFSKIDSMVFEQFVFLNKLVTSEKINEWVRDRMPSDERWKPIFTHFHQNNVPFMELAVIVEFAFYCLEQMHHAKEFSLWSIKSGRGINFDSKLII